MSNIEAVATITSKGQMTLPKLMRTALGLKAGNRVHFTMKGETMEVRKFTDDHVDPALDGFLALLEKDIASGNLVTKLPDHVASLIETRDLAGVNIDEDIEGDVVI